MSHSEITALALGASLVCRLTGRIRYAVIFSVVHKGEETKAEDVGVYGKIILEWILGK
jgi:hypothetical protein